MLSTLDTKSSISNKFSTSPTPKLEIVLMCRNRVNGALRAVEAILNQSMHNFNFYVSDNSVSTQVLDAISALHPHVVIKHRGGYLTQFEHMSMIISESPFDYLLVTHDDDFLLHNFVKIVYSTLSKTQGFGMLLNRVLRFDEFTIDTRAPDLVNEGYDHLENYSSESIILDYLIGRYCNDIYSVSMTVFNTRLAKSCLASMTSTGSHADACFLIKISSQGEVVVNKTPVGVYQISSDSVSNSLSLRDTKLFLRFFYSEGYSKRFSSELKFFKLRARFYYSKINQCDSLYRLKVLFSLFMFVVNPLSLRVTGSFILRRLRCVVM